MFESNAKIRASIIEDDAAIRKIVSRILIDAGIQSKQFGSAEEYLNDQESEEGIIILDIQLPGINGLNFLSTIRDRGNESPVIVLTGTGAPTAMEAMRLGAVRYIGKPFTKNSLLFAVHDILNETHKGG